MKPNEKIETLLAIDLDVATDRVQREKCGVVASTRTLCSNPLRRTQP